MIKLTVVALLVQATLDLIHKFRFSIDNAFASLTGKKHVDCYHQCFRIA